MNPPSTKKLTLIQNGILVTMDRDHRTFCGDILIEGSRIKKIAKKIPVTSKIKKVINAKDRFVIPGLIQAHTHLCQTLMRGEADDMSLLTWLSKRIWPMESHHTQKSIQASARIALLEMQKSGTTTILDMGTIEHTADMLEAVVESKMRYVGGKCLMDNKELSGPLYEETRVSLKETEALIKAWHKKNELMEYAICPRFAVSCTREILEASSSLQKSEGVLIHTHASESLEEIELIKKITGYGNIEYFDKIKILNSKTVVVHGVHVSEKELQSMITHKTPLVHCPSSNLKLASGIAPTDHYRQTGLVMGLGSDGAPCNNTMDPFIEIRLTALLQKPLFGSEAMSAQQAFELATIGGAKVLSKENEIGSLEENKFADIVLVDRSHPSVATVSDPYSALVYSCLGRDVTDVFIHGTQVVKNKKSVIFDEDEVIAQAKKEKASLMKRMNS